MEDNNSLVKVIFFILIVMMGAPVISSIPLFFPYFKLNIGTILIIALGFIIIWIIATYNKLVSLNHKVKQAQSGIDVYLKQRFDLIPNLVETVKGYAAHEKGLMENIAKLRSDYDLSTHEDITESQNLNNRYTRILLMLENYPELKSDEAFVKLQKTLSKIESQLQAARRIYNSEVTQFNTQRYKFPSNIVAGVFGFKEKTLFEIVDSERKNVDINM